MSVATRKMFDLPTEKLLDVLTETLYYLSEQDLTTEQAIAIKDRLNRPLGVIGSKHHIPTNRQVRRHEFMQKSLDSGAG